MSNGRIAAFFDFDRTLLRIDSAEQGIKWAIKNRDITLRYIVKVFIAAQLYKRDLITAQEMAGHALVYYKGKDIEELRRQAFTFYHEWLKPHLCPVMLARASSHREQGHLLVLLSASIDYFLSEVAKDLHFDRLLCTTLEKGADGLGTGRAVGGVCIGANKREAALHLAEQEQIALAESYAYCDHHSDIPLLESVGHPVVIRPTKSLRQVATNKGWEIIETAEESNTNRSRTVSKKLLMQLLDVRK